MLRAEEATYFLKLLFDACRFVDADNNSLFAVIMRMQVVHQRSGFRPRTQVACLLVALLARPLIIPLSCPKLNLACIQSSDC